MKAQYSYLFDDPPPLEREEGKYCDHAGCGEQGVHRAPKRAEGQFFWFCLEHVRTYNASWNYYKDVEDAELEVHIRKNITWDRPSWPMYARSRGYTFFNALHLHEVEEALNARRQKQDTIPKKQKNKEVDEALHLFSLGLPFSKIELRLSYRNLVKLHHPDHKMDVEEKELATLMIQKINVGYGLLKQFAQE